MVKKEEPYESKPIPFLQVKKFKTVRIRNIRDHLMQKNLKLD